MKKTILAIIGFNLLAGAAMAGDISACGNKYLVETTSQSAAQVQAALRQASMNKMLVINTYNPNVGPYALYGLEGSAAYTKDVLTLMQAIQKLPGTIVECDQHITDGGLRPF
jgi:hypothetical protein